MLSYDEALARILDCAPGGPLPGEAVPLSQAYGRVLAADIFSDTDLPPFANSAVDGYAVRQADTRSASETHPVTLRVTQTIPAGYAPRPPVAPGEAARIFTGAPLPEAADALVMVEDTDSQGEESVQVRAPASADFIRAAGSDLPCGARALIAGTALDAAAIGLLAALNHTAVFCPRRPRVALLTTGDEIIPLGDTMLTPGQIRDANGPALAAAVYEAGGVVSVAAHARDTAGEVRAALTAARADCDVLLASGGVSVGGYDVVKEVVESEGKLNFWRIAIKPGKPLAFGSLSDTLFFGLPGNPVSSLVTFELFVRPLLRRLAGHRELTRPLVSVRLAAALPHTPGRREFARARVCWGNDGYQATPMGAQGSHRLASLAGANALLVAHEGHGDYAAGDTLPAMLLM